MNKINCQQCKKLFSEDEIATITRFSLEVKLCKVCAENFKGSRPELLACEYIRDVAEHHGIKLAMLTRLEQEVDGRMTEDETLLQPSREKIVGNRVILSYQQTHFGLPIWGAGLTVWVQKEPLNVTQFQNSIHREVMIEKPVSDAKFMPETKDIKKLIQNLASESDAEFKTITRERLFIYQYDSTQRVESGWLSLKLFPVPETIIDGRHYVVNEVLFTLTLNERGEVNWRAFVEVETGTVLFLRAFVDSVIG